MEHIAHDETSFVRPAEVGEMELYHAKTWLGKYVFSQDAKTIAIQYAATAIAIGMVALVLSWVMRLQLAWPNTFTFIDPAYYLQAVTMHGMIMVVYLLTALFLGGFGNYLIPLMVGARDMVFPWLNMISFWVYFTAVVLLAASFFVGGGIYRCRLDAVSTSGDSARNAGI
jgi:cytochrome c oxidase subunit 1